MEKIKAQRLLEITKTYILQFIYKDGNGWAFVNAKSVSQAESVFKTQTKYEGAKVTNIKETKWFGNNIQVCYEGAVTTYSPTGLTPDALNTLVTKSELYKEMDVYLKKVLAASAYTKQEIDEFFNKVNEKIESIAIPEINIDGLDLSVFATKEDLEERLNNAISNLNLGQYATKNELTTKVREIVSDLNLYSRFYSKAEVIQKINEAISAIDLSIYETRQQAIQDIQNAINDIDYSHFITREEVLQAVSDAVAEMHFPTVVDNYNSNSSTDALSAKRGKELNDRINNLTLDDVIPSTGIPKSKLESDVQNAINYVQNLQNGSGVSGNGGYVASNVVYVTKNYWISKRVNKNLSNVFAIPNTHYIIVENLSELNNTEYHNTKCVFASNCTLSVLEGCMFPSNNGTSAMLQFNDTYINVGRQQIFPIPGYPDSSLGMAGSIANTRILPEWWGAKEGKVYSVDTHGSKYINELATERRGYINSAAINEAIYMCITNNNEVYLGGKEYMIGRTIQDTRPTSISKKANGARFKFYVEGNLVATNHFMGIYYQCDAGTYKVKGGGSGFVYPFSYFPALIYLQGFDYDVTIKGAIVIPDTAQDKNIVLCKTNENHTKLLDENDNEITPEEGNLYFVSSQLLNAATAPPAQNTEAALNDYEVNYVVDVYEGLDRIWYKEGQNHPYLTGTPEEPQVIWRVFNTNTVYRMNRLFHFGTYVLSMKTLMDFKNGTYRGLLPGMYGIYIEGMNGRVNIGRVVKGSDRAGFWKQLHNEYGTYLGVGSFRYLRDVAHQGHCTGVLMGTAQSCTIKIGLIEGFNNGIAFERFYTGRYYMTQFNRFEIGGIGANYAIHINVGDKLASSLISPHKRRCSKTWGASNYYYYRRYVMSDAQIEALNDGDRYYYYTGAGTYQTFEYYQLPGVTTSTYFDGSRWIINTGSEALFAGNNGVSSVFCPTIAGSTYLLVEGSHDETWGWAHDGDYMYSRKGSFSNSWLTFDNAPLRYYAILFDLSAARDNKFELHGNTFGDTGRITLWAFADSNNKLAGETIIKKDEQDDGLCAINTFVGISGLNENPYTWSYYASLIGLEGNITNASDAYYSRTARGLSINDHDVSCYNAPYGTINSSTNKDLIDWKFPYSKTKLYINFRNNSSFNIIKGGAGHLACYNAVYSDNTCERNELHNCQSYYGIYTSGIAGQATGWTLLNGRHPLFEKVQFNTKATPRAYATDTNIADPIRVIYPDEYNLASAKYVHWDDIDNVVPLTVVLDTGPGFYINLDESIQTTSSIFKVTLYKAYTIHVTGYSNSQITAAKKNFEGYIMLPERELLLQTS